LPESMVTQTPSRSQMRGYRGWPGNTSRPQRTISRPGSRPRGKWLHVVIRCRASFEGDQLTRRVRPPLSEGARPEGEVIGHGVRRRSSAAGRARGKQREAARGTRKLSGRIILHASACLAPRWREEPSWRPSGVGRIAGRPTRFELVGTGHEEVGVVHPERIDNAPRVWRTLLDRLAAILPEEVNPIFFF